MANGLGIGPSEAETFWTEFLRSLRACGLGGIRLVISDAHTGLKAAIARVFEATWQRCGVHWMRNALTQASRGQHTVVAALAIVLGPMADNGLFRRSFDQPDRAHAGETWPRVAEQLRPRWPKLADLMDASEHDVLAGNGLRPFLPQTVHRTVCRLRRTGANSAASTAPSCIRRTRANA
jgi:putative transposase